MPTSDLNSEKQSLQLKGLANLRVTDVHSSCAGRGSEQAHADRCAARTACCATEIGKPAIAAGHLLPEHVRCHTDNRGRYSEAGVQPWHG